MLQKLDFPDAQLTLQGAHLTRFREWLFVSSRSHFEPGRAIRGGIPVVFPWFGPNQSARAAPQHGWARTALWEVEAQDEQDVTLTLTQDDWQLRLAYSFGETLRAQVEVESQACQTRSFEFVLHSYFAVSHVSKVQVEGLSGRAFKDKTAGGALKTQQGAVEFKGEVDWVFEDARAPLIVRDGASGWEISGDLASAVVWNPGQLKAQTMSDLGEGEWKKFACVETGVIGANAVHLNAGATWTMNVEIKRL